MKKIIATDYDGTLTIDGIPPRVIEAIEKFRAEGNLFGVVTGRDKIGSYKAFAKEQRFGAALFMCLLRHMSAKDLFSSLKIYCFAMVFQTAMVLRP